MRDGNLFFIVPPRIRKKKKAPSFYRPLPSAAIFYGCVLPKTDHKPARLTLPEYIQGYLA